MQVVLRKRRSWLLSLVFALLVSSVCFSFGLFATRLLAGHQREPTAVQEGSGVVSAPEPLPD